MPAEFDDSEASHKAADAGTRVWDEETWLLLNLYIDGEATAREAAQVERILRSDPSVARTIDVLRLAGNVTRSIVEVEPPAGLCTTILNRTTRRPRLMERVGALAGCLREAFAPPIVRYGLTIGAAAVAAILVLARPKPSAFNGVESVPASQDQQLAMNSSHGAALTPSLTPGIKPAMRAHIGAASHPEYSRTGRRSAPAVSRSQERLADADGTESLFDLPADLDPARVSSARTAQLDRARRPAISAPVRVAQSTVPQDDVHYTSSEPMKVADVPAYHVNPGMDQINEHVAQPMPETGMFPSDDAAVEADSPQRDATRAVPAPKTPQQQAPRTFHGHLILSELPTTSSLTPSVVRFAQPQYDRATLDGIKHGQATISLIGGRF